MAETAPEPTPRWTSQLPARHRLRILEAALQRVAEGVVVDRAGRFLFCNEAARRILGTDSLGATPQPFEQLPLARAMRGEPIQAEDHEVLRQLFQAEQTITPVSDDAGRTTNFVSVMRDVTELKRAQVREVEMRLARVVPQRLYPARPPEVPGFDRAGATFPADHTGAPRCSWRRRVPFSARCRGPRPTSARSSPSSTFTSARTRTTSGSSP